MRGRKANNSTQEVGEEMEVTLSRQNMPLFTDHVPDSIRRSTLVSWILGIFITIVTALGLALFFYHESKAYNI